MNEQHYGRAPCGCERFGPDNPAVYLNGRKCYAINCSEHYQSAPWAAAEALEAGLRAIAGWRYTWPEVLTVPRPTTEPDAWSGGVPFWGDRYVPDSHAVAVEAGGFLVSWREVARLKASSAHKPIESSDTERPKPLSPTPCDICLGNGRKYEGTTLCPRCDADEVERLKKKPAVVRTLDAKRLLAATFCFCGWKLKDGKCPRCGNEQPPGD